MGEWGPNEIAYGGVLRSALDIARDFVREQSQGEWGDDQIDADARILARLLTAYREFPAPPQSQKEG